MKQKKRPILDITFLFRTSTQVKALVNSNYSHLLLLYSVFPSKHGTSRSSESCKYITFKTDKRIKGTRSNSTPLVIKWMSLIKTDKSNTIIHFVIHLQSSVVFKIWKRYLQQSGQASNILFSIWDNRVCQSEPPI